MLHPRDGYGRDEEWVEYHPAYREMESIAFGKFGMHAMCNRGGVLGWPTPMPPIAKYVFHYLFAQAEFGLLCPVNLTDSSSELVRRFGTDELRGRYLERMWSQDPATLFKCAQFMTEKAGGSDVGAAELVAVRDGQDWKLWGEKWFCSNVDAELAVLLARPEGAAAGGRGLGLFLMPKVLPDGRRNSYRILRLKDKLGSRTMASGEIVFEGADSLSAWRTGSGPQADAGHGEFEPRVAPCPRRRHDAAMPERSHARRPASERVRSRRDRPPADAPAIAQADGSDRAGAVGAAVRGDGIRQGAAAVDADRKVPGVPGQRRGRHGGDGGPRRQRLHRRLAQRAARPRCPSRPAVGRHQQHQRAGRGAARGRKGARPRSVAR